MNKLFTFFKKLGIIELSIEVVVKLQSQKFLKGENKMKTNKEIVNMVKEKLQGKDFTVEYLDYLIYFQEVETDKTLATYNKDKGELIIY